MKIIVACVLALSTLPGLAFAQAAEKKPAAAPAAPKPAPAATKPAPAAAKAAPAAAKPVLPAPPPEIKKTVEAFLGKWSFDGSLTGLPGTTEPIKMKYSLACRKAAGGRVAACSGKTKAPVLGKIEDEMLIAYDAEAKAVRFVGMSSMGDVHDHKCTWKDDASVSCDPLSLSVGGKPATVSLTIAWTDAKHVSFTETTTMKDGSKVAFEGKGKRR